MKVLIVDDSKVMRMMLAKMLRQAGYNFEIVEADSGQAALDIFRVQGPGLVLSDWNMPGMSGLELLAALKQIEAQVRFGFITSEQTEQARARALEGGAAFLVAKPFTPEILRLHIDAVFKSV